MTWPWVALAGLGIFHGLNPAMGWLFAVALGLHRRSRGVVLAALVPIAIGHAVAIAVVVFLMLALGMVVDPWVLRLLAGLTLIGWAAYHHFYGSHHRVRIGLRTGMVGLGIWSFVMASAHGAGLMLVPVLLPLAHVAPAHGHVMAGASFPVALAGVCVHTLAMIVTTGVIALVVYEWVGLAFLPRGWVNLDRVWTGALVATGSILILLLPFTH
jgi:hypothetical protein